jgi:hypothetical protein
MLNTDLESRGFATTDVLLASSPATSDIAKCGFEEESTPLDKHASLNWELFPSWQLPERQNIG